MADIDITEFRGRRPKLTDALREPNEATVATNLRLEAGGIKPLRTATTVQAKTVAGTLASIYKYSSGDFLEWEADVDVVPANTGEDQYDRVIFTGDGAPKVSYNTIITSGAAPYPVDEYLLGVPPPGYVVSTYPLGVKATVATNGAATDANSTPEYRYYVITSVDVFGAEGPPCPVSSEVTWRDGQTVDVTIPAAPAGDYNIVGWRMYRTSTGTDGTDFQYVQDGTTFGAVSNDAVATKNLAEVLPTEIYDLPSADMIGITALPNGYLAGFYENTLYFSEPGNPHAWPVDYRLSTKEFIVGIEVLNDNAMAVLTRGHPYVCYGTDPSSMSLDELDARQACVSKRSITRTDAGVVYASPDGLVLISSSGVNVITESVFTREQWQAMDPTTVDGYYWEGVYLFFYNDGVTPAGMAISPRQPEGGIVDYSAYATAGYNSLTEDKLYLVIGGNIVQWDSHATVTYDWTWQSKVFRPLSPFLPSVARLFANEGTTSYTWDTILDGSSVGTSAETDDGPFRLPGGQMGRTFQFSLDTTAADPDNILYGLRVGQNMTDMRGE